MVLVGLVSWNPGPRPARRVSRGIRRGGAGPGTRTRRGERVLTESERLARVERALALVQYGTGIYLGLCVNAAEHPGPREHPHWDDDDEA
jgi:hypothetical protein